MRPDKYPMNFPRGSINKVGARLLTIVVFLLRVCLMAAIVQQPTRAFGSSQTIVSNNESKNFAWGMPRKEWGNLNVSILSERSSRLIPEAKKGFGSIILKPDGTSDEDVKLSDHELNVEVIEEKTTKARLVVTVPAHICDFYWRKAVNRLQNERKAKAGTKNQASASSENVLVSLYGTDEIKRYTLEMLMKETANETFAPVAERMITNKYSQHFVKSGEEMIAEFVQSKPFRFEVQVDLLPQVNWPKEKSYLGMEIAIKMDLADPSEEADKEFRSLLREKGILRVKQGDGLESGDVGILDLHTVRVNPDGTPGEKILSCCEEGFTVDTESSLFMPGFVSGMLGITRGEERTYDLVFPPDWPLKALRGVVGRFQVTCKELFVREYPPLDEATAGELVPGAQNVDEAQEMLREKHNKLFKDGMNQAINLAVLAKLLELCEIDVPDSLILEDAQQLFSLHLAQIQAKYNPTPQQLQEMSSEDQFRLFVKVQYAQCEARVKQAMAIDDIYDREPDVQVSDEELQLEFDDALKQFQGSEDQIDMEKLKEQAFVLIKEKKTLAWLAEMANVSFAAV